MKGMIQLKHSRITIAIITFVAIISLSGIENHSHANPKFREFTSDADRFERHIETAENTKEVMEWQRIVLDGKALLKADWEKDADLEIERVIREEGGDDIERQKLNQQKEMALAEWEGLIDAHMAKEEGKWYAARQNILYADIDKDKIQSILSQTIGNVDITTLDEWDSAVFPEINTIGDIWSQELNTVLSEIRKAGDTLDSKVRESYLSEITRIEDEIRSAFRLDQNTLVYRARNKYIMDTLYDSNSLRTRSESESGEAVADKIIAETEDSLSEEEAKLLHDGTNAEGSGDIDFSKLGDNWEQELSRLIENGMNQWNQALDQLYGEMRDWRGDAQSVYDTGDDQWRKAYDKLYDARDAWYTKISEEINKGIESWKEREDDLNQNLDQARVDFQKYIQTLNDQWADHSMGLRDMISTGANIYGESKDNIQWLEDMVERYINTPAFENNSTALYDFINSQKDNLIENAKASINLQSGETKFFYSKCYFKESLSVQSTRISNQYDINTDTATERYQINFIVNRQLYHDENFTQPLWYPTSRTVQTITFDNVMSETSPAEGKSSYFIYNQELKRWNELQKRFKQVVIDTEEQIHDKNMLGDPDGPGFLVNNGKEGDPYLMTDAEAAVNLANKEKEYWESRLRVAEAVKEYAEATGIRESAEETIAKKDAALTAMESAKKLYNDKLTDISTIVDRLKVIQGTQPPAESDPQSITYLTDKLMAKEKELKKAEEEFIARKRAVIVLENEQDVEFIKEELHEIEQNLIYSEQKIRDARFEYFTKSRDTEHAERLSAFAGLYQDTVLKRTAAKESFDTFGTVVKGTESEANVSSWIGALDSKKNIIWGDEASARYGKLTELHDTWNKATGDEKVTAWQNLITQVRQEYLALETAMAVYDMQYEKLKDDDFNYNEFLQNRNNFNTDVYQKTATLNRDAFELISDTLKAIESKGKDYDTLNAALKGELDKYAYKYGEDNSEYSVRYAAWQWSVRNLKNINTANFTAIQKKVSDEYDAADEIVSLYGSYSTFETEDHSDDANEGDYTARSLLSEYYSRGSSMHMLPFLEECGSQIQTSDTVYQAMESFTATNKNTLLWNETQILSTNYSTDIIEFINSNNGGQFTLTAESMETLDPASLAKAAHLLSSYVKERESAGSIVPSSVKELANRFNTLYESITEHLYIQGMQGISFTGIISDDTKKAVAVQSETAEKTFGEAQRIKDFIDGSLEIINSSQLPACDVVSGILSSYDALGDVEKAVLGESDDEQVQALLNRIADFRKLGHEKEKQDLAVDFTGASTALSVQQFIDARCSSWTASEKSEMTIYLTSFAEKRAYLESGHTGSIDEYLKGRGLTGDLNKEIRSFALIHSFKSTTGSGTVNNDPMFSDFNSCHSFEEYLGGETRGASETTDDFISRVVSAFVSVFGGDSNILTTFGELNLSGDITSAAYLPDEVQYFLAYGSYFENVYAMGDYLLNSNAIDDYIDGAYGSSGISGTARGELESLIQRFGAIDRYLGQDINPYLESLSSEEQDLFLTYYLLTENDGSNPALVPGFSEGIYGIQKIAKAEQKIIQGKYEFGIEGLREDLAGAANAIQTVYDTARIDSIRKNALKNYVDNPGEFANYRNYVIDYERTTQVPKKNGTGFEEETETILTVEEITGIAADKRNDETGVISTIYKGREDNDNGSSVESLIIEDTNELVKLFDTLFKTSGKQAVENDNTITAFLEQTASIYNSATSYGKNGEGVYSFEKSLGDIVSKYNALRVSESSEAEQAQSQLGTLESTCEGFKAALEDRGATYRLMSGSNGSLDALRAQMDVAAVTRRQIEDGYQEIQDQLLTAQRNYSSVNEEYIESMNEAANLYKTYQDQEFSYEKAYAVWEYANTPYLNKESNTGATDDATNKAPDALENYNRIKTSYDSAIENLTAKEAILASQETIEKLQSDSAYADVRDTFKDKTEAFIRSTQTDVLVGEDIQKLRDEQQKAFDAYAASKAALDGAIFSSKENGKEETILLRDTLLEKIIGKNSGDIPMFMNSVVQYYFQYHTLYSYKASHLGGVKHNYSNYFMSRHEDWGKLSGETKTIINMLFSNINMFNYSNYLEDLKGKSNYNYYYKDIAENEEIVRYYDYLKEQLGGLHNTIDTLYQNFNPVLLSQMSNHLHLSVYYYTCQGKERENIVQFQQYWSKRSQANQKINTYINAKKRVEDVTAKLYTYERARDLAGVKEKLKSEGYQLTDEDIALIYDETETVVPDGGINITALRKTAIRKDSDGRDVKAVKEGDTVYLLTLNGNKTGESFNVSDISFLLKDEDGSTITGSDIQDGEAYSFYDYTYDVADISRVLTGRLKEQRNDSRNEIETYMASSTEAGLHDSTIMLRDFEFLYWSLATYAKDLGADTGEDRQRRFEGYQTLISELVHDGNGTSVHDRIVQSMVNQNRASQELLWEQKTRQFNEKRDKWLETVNYIVNRGSSDWTNHLNRIDNEWRKWRLDTRDAIEEGEKLWENALGQFKGEMKTWQESTTNASSDAATEKMFNELTDTINRSMNSIRLNLPGRMKLSIDTDRLIAEAMKNAPVDSIGVLSDSMNAFDTTVGFDSLMSLNLSGSLQERFENEVDIYEKQMSVMKNLRIMDVLNGVIDQFQDQLEEQNQNMYDDVLLSLRPNFNGPFVRGKIWTMKYLAGRTAFHRNYEYYLFDDYKGFNKELNFKNIRGYDGSEIDFTDPGSFMNLDYADLEIYVRLEKDHLQKQVDAVFGADGEFSNHVQGQFDLLSAHFKEGQKRYGEGQTLSKKHGWRVPLWKGGIDTTTLTRVVLTVVAACVPYAGPALALAVNGAFMAFDVADGTINPAHGLMQFGVAVVSSVASAYTGGIGGAAIQLGVRALSSGIEYNPDGSIGYSIKKVGRSLKSGMATALVEALLPEGAAGTGLSATFGSMFNDRGNFWDISFDTSNMAEHLTTGLAAGLSSRMGKLAGDNMYTRKLLTSSITSGVKMASFHALGGRGFRKEGDYGYQGDFGSFAWNSLYVDHKDYGSALGSQLGHAIRMNTSDDYRDRYNSDAAVANRKIEADKGFFDRLSDWGNDITDFGNDILDFGESLGNWASGDGWNTNEVLASHKRIRERIAAGKAAGIEFDEDTMMQQRINQEIDIDTTHLSLLKQIIFRNNGEEVNPNNTSVGENMVVTDSGVYPKSIADLPEHERDEVMEALDNGDFSKLKKYPRLQQYAMGNLCFRQSPLSGQDIQYRNKQQRAEIERLGNLFSDYHKYIKNGNYFSSGYLIHFEQTGRATNTGDAIGGAPQIMNDIMSAIMEYQIIPKKYESFHYQQIGQLAVNIIENKINKKLPFEDSWDLSNNIMDQKLPKHLIISSRDKKCYQWLGKSLGFLANVEIKYAEYIFNLSEAFMKGPQAIDKLYESGKGYRFNQTIVYIMERISPTYGLDLQKINNIPSFNKMNTSTYKRLRKLSIRHRNLLKNKPNN